MTTLEELRWKKFPVLDQGWVCLVDVMGDDSSVVQAARVSYGAGTKSVSDDRTLIRFLYRHAHMTPFEMAEVKLLVRVPMDCWRQWSRHRTANVNEYSTRYSEAIDAAQQTDPGQWRQQSAGNKQGSGGTVTDWPEGWCVERIRDHTDKADPDGCSRWRTDPSGGVACGAEATPGEYLSELESDFQAEARRLYETRLQLGVAREQARKDLPLSTYTEAYWKCDLRNLLGFLSLRMDGHAQKEIRDYATVIGEQIVAPLFPECWDAFNDYDQRRGGLLLSALDVQVVHKLDVFPRPSARNHFLNAVQWAEVGWPGLDTTKKSREQEECWGKLLRLGLVRPD